MELLSYENLERVCGGYSMSQAYYVFCKGIASGHIRFSSFSETINGFNLADAFRCPDLED